MGVGGGSFGGDITGGNPASLVVAEAMVVRSAVILSHRRTTHEIRARQHPVVVRDVGGVAEVVVVLVATAKVPVGPAAQPEPRGPFAKWLDA